MTAVLSRELQLQPHSRGVRTACGDSPNLASDKTRRFHATPKQSKTNKKRSYKEALLGSWRGFCGCFCRRFCCRFCVRATLTRKVVFANCFWRLERCAVRAALVWRGIQFATIEARCSCGVRVLVARIEFRLSSVSVSVSQLLSLLSALIRSSDKPTKQQTSAQSSAKRDTCAKRQSGAANSHSKRASFELHLLPANGEQSARTELAFRNKHSPVAQRRAQKGAAIALRVAVYNKSARSSQLAMREKKSQKRRKLNCKTAN